jgi:acid phosphatase
MASKRRLAAVGALAAAAVAGAGVAYEATTTSTSGPPPPSPAITRVVLVMFENKPYAKVRGHMPYLDGLAGGPNGAQLSNDYGTNYPSNPNYLRITSGTSTTASGAIIGDCQPGGSKCSSAAPSIFSELGTRWRVWAESMPSPCYLKNVGKYVPRHTAAPYYTNIRSACKTLDVPLPATPIVPAGFVLVAPNMVNDMHDGTVAQGDKWLRGFLPLLLDQKAFIAGHMLIEVTWDTSDGRENCKPNPNSCPSHVWAVLLNPRFGGTVVTTRVTHDAVLALNENVLGVPLTGGARNAPDLRPALGLG